jgi:hypothetical protein
MFIQNPFIDDSIVTKDDYCRRKIIEEALLLKIKNGQKSVLIGDRRIGKTSTSHYVVDELSNLKKVDLDFYHVKDVGDIAQEMISKTTKTLSEIWDFKSLSKFVSKLSPSLEVNESGSVNFGIGLNQTFKSYENTLEIAFNLIDEAIKRSNNNLVIIIDEFQQILSVKDGDSILKFMRGKIQKLQRIPILYVGSNRHQIESIFLNSSSPFYKQADIVNFSHIGEDIFYDFLKEKFKAKNIDFQKTVFFHLYSVCYGITRDIQYFCRVSFDILESGDLLDFKAFFHIMNIIYKNENLQYERTVNGEDLTKNQVALALHLAQFPKNDNLFTRETLTALQVKTAANVQKAIDALIKKDYIYESDGIFKFVNPYFKEWLLDERVTISMPAGLLRPGQPLRGTRLDYDYRKQFND